MLRVGHVRNEIERVGECLIVVRSTPIVENPFVIRGRAGIITGARNHCRTECAARPMHRIGRLAHKRSERILVTDVHVLNIELNAIEMLITTERCQTANCTAPRVGHCQQAMNKRLIEARIHHEWYQFRVRCMRLRNHSRIHAASNDSVAVERKNLRAGNRNLIGMRQKTLHAFFAAGCVPQRLERARCSARGTRFNHYERDQEQPGEQLHCVMVSVVPASPRKTRIVAG